MRMLVLALSESTLQVADVLGKHPKMVALRVISDIAAALEYIEREKISGLDAIVVEMGDVTNSNEADTVRAFDDILAQIKQRRAFIGKIVTIFSEQNAHLADRAFRMKCDSYFCIDPEKIDKTASEILASVETGALMVSPQLRMAFYSYCNSLAPQNAQVNALTG